MKNKNLKQKYRFISTSKGLAFESRYYADKFIKEVIPKYVGAAYGYEYEIKKDGDYYFIYEIVKDVVDAGYLEK